MTRKKLTTVLTIAMLLLCSVAQAQIDWRTIEKGVETGERIFKKSKKKKQESAATPGGIAKTAKTTLKINTNYKLKISSAEFADFKIITPEDGNLTLAFETFAERTDFALYNENGVSFNPTNNNIGSGEANTDIGGYYYNAKFNRQDKVTHCLWSSTVEKFEGSFTYKLDEGTYYLRIIRSQKGLSTANLAVTFKDLDGNEVNAQPTDGTPVSPPVLQEGSKDKK